MSACPCQGDKAWHKGCHRGLGTARHLGWAGAKADDGQTAAKGTRQQICKLICSLSCSCSMLQVLRSFSARCSLRIRTHLCAWVYDYNCLSHINILKEHDPTKDLLLTIIFKVSLIKKAAGNFLRVFFFSVLGRKYLMIGTIAQIFLILCNCWWVNAKH